MLRAEGVAVCIAGAEGVVVLESGDEGGTDGDEGGVAQVLETEAAAGVPPGVLAAASGAEGVLGGVARVSRSAGSSITISDAHSK